MSKKIRAKKVNAKTKPFSKIERDQAILHSLGAITPEMKKRVVPTTVRTGEDGREITVTGINVADDYLLKLYKSGRLEEGSNDRIDGSTLANARIKAAERFAWDWHLASLSSRTTTAYEKLAFASSGSQQGFHGRSSGPIDVNQIRADARQRFNKALLTIPVTIQQVAIDLIIDRKRPYPKGATAASLIKARSDGLTALDILGLHYGIMQAHELRKDC